MGAKAAGHTAPKGERPKALDADTWLTLRFGPSPRNGAAHSQGSLPTLVNPRKEEKPSLPRPPTHLT